MVRLSAVIITFNEERNIARCLESIGGLCDEIVVVDSFSNDNTQKICEQYGAKFIRNKWPGYTEQKNFANSQANNDHILSLDADEALSPELRASILRAKESWTSPAYEMNRLTNYCGKWIRHGSWYPDRQLRLFDRTRGSWQGQKIHERFVLSGDEKPGFLEGDILHYSYYTISGHVAQANHFTDLTAEAAHLKGKNATMWKVIFSPAFKFMRDYFFKLGFLDGYFGYVVCRISAHATFLKYIKLRELAYYEKKRSNPDENA
jgi:glycosyltransferase involved in cell wall biosynthesis